MVRQTIDEGFSEAGEDGRWEPWEGERRKVEVKEGRERKRK